MCGDSGRVFWIVSQSRIFQFGYPDLVFRGSRDYTDYGLQGDYGVLWCVIRYYPHIARNP